MGCTNVGAHIGTKYEIPFGARWSLSSATPAQKAERREAIKSFINGAREGNIYSFGSYSKLSSAGDFMIVSHKKSPNGLGIRSLRSNSNTIALSPANAEKYIGGGIRLVRREKSARYKQTSLF